MTDLNSFNTQSKSKKTGSKTTNFIEAIRDLGSSVQNQAKDATLGTGQDFMKQIFGMGVSKPQASQEAGENSPFNFADYLKSREQQIAQVERRRSEQRIHEERTIYHRKQAEVKIQLKVVQEELVKMAKSTQGLTEEIKTAATAILVDPGTYHENFFSRLRNLIILARKKISESKLWLEMFNHRSKKRMGYWGQVKQSGTKFMLSQERYMVTQTG